MNFETTTLPRGMICRVMFLPSYRGHGLVSQETTGDLQKKSVQQVFAEAEKWVRYGLHPGNLEERSIVTA